MTVLRDPHYNFPTLTHIVVEGASIGLEELYKHNLKDYMELRRCCEAKGINCSIKEACLGLIAEATGTKRIKFIFFKIFEKISSGRILFLIPAFRLQIQQPFCRISHTFL